MSRRRSVKTAGYVVVCDGMLMRIHLDHTDVPAGGVLVFGATGTIFRTRGRARRAINRTVKYAEERGLQWAILDSTKRHVERVQEEP